MYIIGVYKFLFNPSYGCIYAVADDVVPIDPKYIKNKLFSNRIGKEIDFQNNFWKILNRLNLGVIDTRLVTEVLLLLYNLSSNEIEEVSKSIQGNLNKTKSIDVMNSMDRVYTKGLEENIEDDSGKSNWTYTDLVKKFNELNETKFTGESSRFLWKHNIIKKEGEPNCTFKPKIDEKSEMLADKRLDKFLSETKARTEANNSETGSIKGGTEWARPGSGQKYYKNLDSSSSNQSSKTISSIQSRIAQMNEMYLKRNENIKNARIEKMNAELRECTFSPSLYRHKSPSPRRKDNIHGYEKLIV